MIRALVEQTFDATKKYFVLAGLSTDSKPTTGIVTGSKFIEVDTGTNFAFDEVSGTWSASNITMQDIKDEIDSWLEDNIDPDSGYALDRTLSLSNAAAPADMVGDLKSAMNYDEKALLQSMYRNFVDPELLALGYYTSPGVIHAASEQYPSYYLPKFRISKGETYRFYNVYGYFCFIQYDDGTVARVANSASPSTVSVNLTATDNGYCYATIKDPYHDTAKIVAGYGNGTVSTTSPVGFFGPMTVFGQENITPGIYSSLLPNLASAKANSIYRITMLKSMTVDGTMTDVPDELKFTSSSAQMLCVLITIGQTNVPPCTQILLLKNGNIYIRYYNPTSGGNVWTSWVSKTNIEALSSPHVLIIPSNYATLLPSLDDPNLAGTAYNFTSTKAMMQKNGGLWGDVPLEMQRGQCTGTILTIGNESVSSITQIISIANVGKTYIRFRNYNGSQYNWTLWKAYNQHDVIIASDGTGDFTTLTEGIAYAVNFPGCHVYVRPGTYNIIEEYKTLYGDDFFTNYTESTANVGIVLSNNIVVEFSPNAYVVCEYEGNNTYVQNRFSPLNSGAKGFTLINCNIISRKVRYGFHDERNQNTDYYHNKFIGCHFNHDKNGGSGYIQALGGGLGLNGLIEIDNCIFENPSDTGRIVSYHNCKSSGARSKVLIRNSMVKGSIRFSYYGSSTLVSPMFVNGCKMFYEPIITQETSSYTTVNVELLAWGNTVGTF